MRISDWSSDVCSSDLPRTDAALGILRLEPKGSRTHVAMKYAESQCANLPGNTAPMSVRVASEEQWSVQVHHRFRTDMLHPPLPLSAEPVKASSDARRGGSECVSTCSYRLLRYPYTK